MLKRYFRRSSWRRAGRVTLAPLRRQPVTSPTLAAPFAVVAMEAFPPANGNEAGELLYLLASRQLDFLVQLQSERVHARQDLSGSGPPPQSRTALASYQSDPRRPTRPTGAYLRLEGIWMAR